MLHANALDFSMAGDSGAAMIGRKLGEGLQIEMFGKSGIRHIFEKAFKEPFTAESVLYSLGGQSHAVRVTVTRMEAIEPFRYVLFIDDITGK